MREWEFVMPTEEPADKVLPLTTAMKSLRPIVVMMIAAPEW